MIRERAPSTYERLGRLPSHELAMLGTTGLRLVPRSCSLLNVDPHVLHRHSAFGVRADLVTFTPCWGLQDKDSSSPQCKHKCLDKTSSLLGPARYTHGSPLGIRVHAGNQVGDRSLHRHREANACHFVGRLATMRRLAGRNPISSIRSASSSTNVWI